MPARHIVAMLVPAWGHTVSYIYLATQMLQKDPDLVITMVQHSSVVGQMEAELKTCTYDTARIRIIGVGKKDFVFSTAAIKECIIQLIEGWMEVIIPQLSQASEAWPKPQALHLDFAVGGIVIEPTKKMVGPDCKILIWWSSGLVSMPGHLNDYDFIAIAEEIYADEARREGRSMDDIVDAIGQAWNGSDRFSGLVIKCPGVPDMYDYERVSFAAGPAQGVAQVLVAAQKLAKVVDGIIVPTSLCIEPVGVPYCREFYHKLGHELFTVGLQAHEQCWTDAPPAPPTNATVAAFLATALAEHGPKSVLYISFGSLFFPVATPALVEALMDTLLSIEQPLPFVFALGGKLATLPPALVARANASGRGLVCEFWVEQRAILQHAALGWFLTHGGWNSVSDSLSQGIPLIVWPTNAEQPVNAALLSSGPHPVAIELVQVRTGPQVAPSLRGGAPILGTPEAAAAEFKAVFAAARGERGASLRANAVGMKAALRKAREGEVGGEIGRLVTF
ncbi:hypothetical protein C8R44DRAFT_991172 [Mycena epipterygia]|nr:hypothetical protein C8R44DRAFT_991172 [Mycena epipterygia]